MIVTRPLLELSAIAQVILDPTASPGACKQACDAFYHHGLNHLPPLLECDSQLGVGRALAPSHAARCVQDFVRTARLTQAVAAAIECRRRQHGPVSRCRCSMPDAGRWHRWPCCPHSRPGLT